MKHLICASIQFNISLGYIDANLDTATAALQRVAQQGARLAVLPEMWSCGYDYRNLTELAKETPRVLEEMQKECLKLDLVTVGSLPELEDDRIFGIFNLSHGNSACRFFPSLKPDAQKGK